MAKESEMLGRGHMLDILGEYSCWLNYISSRYKADVDDVAKLVCRFEKLVNSQTY